MEVILLYFILPTFVAGNKVTEEGYVLEYKFHHFYHKYSWLIFGHLNHVFAWRKYGKQSLLISECVYVCKFVHLYRGVPDSSVG